MMQRCRGTAADGKARIAPDQNAHSPINTLSSSKSESCCGKTHAHKQETKGVVWAGLSNSFVTKALAGQEPR